MPEDDFHPTSNIFPLLEGPDFDAFVDDVRTNRLREPIWRHRDGRIVDGRNRWRACQALGINCPSRTFEGDDSEILAFVISQNLHRRHLDTSQRAHRIVFQLRRGARCWQGAATSEGEPGYSPHLDRDGDGIACEPWRRQS